MSRRRSFTALAAVSAALVAAALPSVAAADTDPTGCTPNIAYDSSIPTFQSVTGVEPGAGGIGQGRSTGAAVPAATLYQYADALVAATANSTRVRILKKPLGTSPLGKELNFYVVSTPDNIANLDDGRNDGGFWAGVREGTVPEATGLAQASQRPSLAWITATPHGNEPAAGEAIAREMYELAARTDCQNARRLKNLDLFMDLARNPDGRDNNQRYTAWSYDPNRDFGTQNQGVNSSFIPIMNKYPGLFFIDAHQNSSGYFFPPNEDPVHHEISTFSLNFIQNDIGPALQQTFNDQGANYQNYNTYDLFTPEYGDTVPSLIMGAAGMTYEKGTNELYAKQVFDHYQAIDTTINLTSNQKIRLTQDWTKQWQEAVDQGAQCDLQPNKLVSVPHQLDGTQITQQPNTGVCGYYYKPGLHTGDVAALLKLLQSVGVKAYKINKDTPLTGVHQFGSNDAAAVLPAGTIYIPMAQTMKHWIQAVLGENPFIPYDYYYDVVTWSYSLQRGLGGDGFLTNPSSVPDPSSMTQITAPDFGTVPAASSKVYAFDTDSMAALGLTNDLLSRGVTVYRAASAFDTATKSFQTGAALVDGTSLAASGADLSALAKARQTPVTGLDRYPVARYALTKPKIALYTGNATGTNTCGTVQNFGNVCTVVNGIPTFPGSTYDTVNTNPQTKQCTSPAAFCETLDTLMNKDGIPAAQIIPVTSTDVANGVLVSGGYTAFINPATTIAAGAGATAVQTFVNGGGIYVGYNAGGITSARNAGLTLTNTVSLGGSSAFQTPGSTFDGTYLKTNPVGWGFDTGGWIYRDSTSNPIIDPATLAGGSGIPAATAVVSYATTGTGRVYGYTLGAYGAGKIDGRPAVVDQPFGSGHAVLFGFDPFFRAWKEQDERLVLNALLYPLGASIPASTGPITKADPPLTKADVVEAAAPVADPVPAKALPAVKNNPVTYVSKADADIVITVRSTQASKLKAAVKKATFPKSVRKRATYKRSGSKYSLILKGARTAADDHDRTQWTGSIVKQLAKRGVKPLNIQT